MRLTRQSHCKCHDFETFDSMYGGIKILVATPYSLEGMDEWGGQCQYFRDVWGFKYCPFCKNKL